jgi:regulator of cell morphogenesis and NO signaling
MSEMPINNKNRNWSNAPLAELIDYIENSHRTLANKQLPQLQQLLEKTLNIHDEQHCPMLRSLQETFMTFKTEIEKHFAREEKMLIPYIRQMDDFKRNAGAKPKIPLSNIQNPISQIEYEHDHTESALLDEIRDITSDFLLPKDASDSFKVLYDGLKELRADVYEHIHLENDILFPKSIELELSIMHG